MQSRREEPYLDHHGPEIIPHPDQRYDHTPALQEESNHLEHGKLEMFALTYNDPRFCDAGGIFQYSKKCAQSDLTTALIALQLCALSGPPMKLPSQIAGTLCEEQFRDYVPTLHDDEVAQLVECLDNVRLPLTFPDSVLVYNHSRFYALWILQALLPRSAYACSGGCVVLGEHYQNLS